MNIEMVGIDSIRPYINNPRKNDKAVKTVAESIEQYGFQQPIVVDNDNVIIAGHTRYRAAKQLGLKDVPVLVAKDLDEKSANAYRIMDNKSSEKATWDDALLIEELNNLMSQDLHELAYETGFTESELNKLFPDDTVDPLANINTDTHTIAKPGDIWLLSEHRLMCGDSTSEENIRNVMLDNKIDLLWEDPPYGISYETANGINHSKEYNEAKNHKIKNDDLTPEQLDAFLNAHIKAIDKYIKPGASVYWSHDIRFHQQFKDILETNKYHISDTLIWKKNGASNWLSNYAKIYEPVFYGWKTGATAKWYGYKMNKNAVEQNNLEDMSREELIKIIQSIPTNYQEISREPLSVAKLHPTVKPVKMIVYHIINSTAINDVVFDGFSGSGSTLLACEKTGRRYRTRTQVCGRSNTPLARTHWTQSP